MLIWEPCYVVVSCSTKKHRAVGADLVESGLAGGSERWDRIDVLADSFLGAAITEQIRPTALSWCHSYP